jgi:hypothetical protein
MPPGVIVALRHAEEIEKMITPFVTRSSHAAQICNPKKEEMHFMKTEEIVRSSRVWTNEGRPPGLPKRRFQQ